MSLLADLKNLLSDLDVMVETGKITGKAPDQYIVMVPLSDSFDVYADNAPGIDIQEVRISIFSKGNYLQLKNRVINTLIQNEITISDRHYVGHENDSGYHHYNIDAANYYEMEEE